MFHLKRFSSFLPRHRPDRNFSGFIEEKFAAIRYLTKMKSRPELSFLRRSLTVGSRDGQRISRLGSWNAGRPIKKTQDSGIVI
jgi:hypothetical protein